MRVAIVDPALTTELRRSVLRPQLPVGAPLPGDDLPDAVHFAAVDDDGTPVSTCFVYTDPCPWRPDARPVWHLRQMATRPGRRGTGAGSLVVEALIDHVGVHGGGLLWCNARELAIPFYERAGFVGEGSIFTDDVHTIPHLRMWRTVAAAG